MATGPGSRASPIQGKPASVTPKERAPRFRELLEWLAGTAAGGEEELGFSDAVAQRFALLNLMAAPRAHGRRPVPAEGRSRPGRRHARDERRRTSGG